MSKKYIFYDKYAKMKKRLFIAVLVTAFVSFGTGLGVLKLSNLKSIGMSLETVYENRVKPLKQLKMLSDIYILDVIDTVNKIYTGIISWHGGRNSIEEAAKEISHLWSEYKQNYRVEEEIRLVEDIDILFKTVDKALIKLTRILVNEDHNALLEFIKDDLYRSIKPVTTQVNELFEMQVRSVKKIHEQEQKRYKVSLQIGVATIITSAFLLVIAMFQWRRFSILLKSL